MGIEPDIRTAFFIFIHKIFREEAICNGAREIKWGSGRGEQGTAKRSGVEDEIEGESTYIAK